MNQFFSKPISKATVDILLVVGFFSSIGSFRHAASASWGSFHCISSMIWYALIFVHIWQRRQLTKTSTKCKYFVLFFGLFFFAENAIAQVTLSGRILSQSDKEPLPYSTVVIVIPSENRLVSGVVTNDEGRFTITGLEPGEYDVQVDFLGYEQVKKDILVGTLNQFLDLGTIFLTPSLKPDMLIFFYS